MTEIEFLDPGDPAGSARDADRPDDEPAGPDLRRLAPALAAAVAWVLAAGLAVMASVSNVYELVIDSDGSHQTVSVDAWGRFNTSGLNKIVGHQTRYAVVLVVAAVLLLAAALVAVARLAVSRYLAVAGTAVAAAIATTLLLYVQATRSTNAIQARQVATGYTVRTDLGSAFWLAAGATVAALVGIVLAFVLKPPADPDEPAHVAEPAGYPTEVVEPVSGGAAG